MPRKLPQANIYTEAVLGIERDLARLHILADTDTRLTREEMRNMTSRLEMHTMTLTGMISAARRILEGK